MEAAAKIYAYKSGQPASNFAEKAEGIFCYGQYLY
jgi:hypothetical protein